mmetsp:Transcript_19454/g.33425  ORF Transcript_19454/g.33425 Transcript_19454/m.33425 type:complete len:122 (-) Transcript_19454:646-1011(-)|eukprot:CAMPEP_0196662338 /NCGR_PEP_ID=MMETSP1086-20130531/48264_1 /TAXON_ID=77921 /ORGANISM="Cyanoptyche  gloeocystis , Strain SAG4.97" /LENGTH=121 /DNA_ID=CAMNT_0041997669 /DNA_START=169 /DNA_END=534 /DNA_ORIENTATION=+
MPCAYYVDFKACSGQLSPISSSLDIGTELSLRPSVKQELAVPEYCFEDIFAFEDEESLAYSEPESVETESTSTDTSQSAIDDFEPKHADRDLTDLGLPHVKFAEPRRRSQPIDIPNRNNRF